MWAFKCSDPTFWLFMNIYTKAVELGLDFNISFVALVFKFLFNIC